MTKKVIENIRILRESRGYSQDYMAELIGITQSAYARFERGVTKTDFHTMVLIAEALEIPVIDIITYPKKYTDTENTAQKTSSNEPEVIVQIKVAGEKKKQILKSMLADGELELL
jgi:transcriptional regulator with XRE-family HTH domain